MNGLDARKLVTVSYGLYCNVKQEKRTICLATITTVFVEKRRLQ